MGDVVDEDDDRINRCELSANIPANEIFVTMLSLVATQGAVPRLLVVVKDVAENYFFDDVIVPREFVNRNGHMILNVDPKAVEHFFVGMNKVTFTAAFGGVKRHVEIPFWAMLGVHSIDASGAIVRYVEFVGGLYQDEPDDLGVLADQDAPIETDSVSAGEKQLERKDRVVVPFRPKDKK